MAGYLYTEFTDHQTGSARPGEGYDDWLYEAGRDVDEAEEQIKEWLPCLWVCHPTGAKYIRYRRWVYCDDKQRWSGDPEHVE